MSFASPLRRLPLRYRVLFGISVAAACLSILMTVVVVVDLIEQASWRDEDQAAHREDMRAHCRTESLLMGHGTERCAKWERGNGTR